MKNVGFIGLGTMGGPMARNLLSAGYNVTAYDVDESLITALSNEGALSASSAFEAATDQDMVITMLPNGAIVEDVLFGQTGIVDALSSQCVLVDMSTILPAQTDSIHRRLNERGIATVDAPVGRSSQHAIEGKLLIMMGGETEAVERVRSALEHLGDTLVHCGAGGFGQRMKIVNNYMSIALNVLTAESLVLAEASGLDTKLAREVMLGTVAGQGHMATTYPAKVLKQDLTPGFMVNLAHKDMGLALDMAAELNVPMFMGAASRQSYAIARREGRGRQDWTALYQGMRDILSGPKAG